MQDNVREILNLKRDGIDISDSEMLLLRTYVWSTNDALSEEVVRMFPDIRQYGTYQGGTITVTPPEPTPDEDGLEEFELDYDELNSVWHRRSFTVRATSKEEAIEKLRKKMEDWTNQDEDVEEYDSEYLYDTAEALSPDENGGSYTVEIMDGENGDSHWNNVDGLIMPKVD